MNYNDMDERVRRRASEHLDYVAFGRPRENNFKFIIILLIVADIVHFIIGRTYKNSVGFIVMLVIIYIGLLYVYTKRAGVGISVDKFIYIRYSNIVSRELKVEEVPFEKIQYLDCKKFLLGTSIKMTYIDELGKLRLASFMLHNKIASKYRKRYLENVEGISKKFFELQKVLDKGDF